MKLILSLFFLLSGTSGISSDTTSLKENTNLPITVENTEDDMQFIPESWDTDLAELMNSWHIKYYVDKNANPAYHEAVTASDSVYAERLSKLNNIIELPYNEIVRKCIDLYINRRRTIIEYMLGLENLYFPMIEQVLDAKKLPHELKYLTIVESALNPTALSRAGASGLWQFMLGTGKQYGLEINSLIDERRDPRKSTYAACEYLNDLYGIYSNWTLALAAYNCGPGNVNKAIRRANGANDYWKIYPYLPKETRLYVPLFIAANYAMNYYANHQLYPVQTNMPAATDTVVVNQSIHFDQIAEVLNMDKELIRALNPQYKRDIVPGNSQPRTITLPVLQAYAFVEKENSIAKHRKDDLFANRIYVNNHSAARKTIEKIIHRVNKGETIGSIGSRYGVSTASIRKWNRLPSNKLQVGDKLTIYTDNGGYASETPAPSKETIYNARNTASKVPAQTPEPAPNIAAVEENASANIRSRSAGDIAASYMTRLNNQKNNTSATVYNPNEQNTQYERYQVKSGDSFYSIAKKYPGYSQNDLMRINNMKNYQLKIGQYLKVPKI